jgi:Putative prokaryotic signal transducing protein
MKTVAVYSKSEDAYLARSCLEGSGIEATVRDDLTASVYWLYANAIGGVKLDVADEDYDRAREVLSLPAVEPGILQCPYCGSDDVRVRELSPLAAICIGLGFILPFRSRKADCGSCHRSFDFVAPRKER